MAQASRSATSTHRYWFLAKQYGWGWVPTTWQGWGVTGAFIVFVIWNNTTIQSATEPTQDQMLWYFVKLIAATALLLSICYKTGEKPRWRWGK